MTQIRGVHIETLHTPSAYTPRQLGQVCKIAARIARGRFVLCEPPARTPRDA